MRVKFWSDTNERGFTDAIDDLFNSTLAPSETHVYEIPDELLPLAEEWGATPVGDQNAQG